ncbi:HEAT repeat domain-containing protein, partial [Methanocalculus sp.]
AVRMLGRIKDPNTVSHLIGVLADPDPEVRTSAIVALTGIGKGSLPELTAAFENSDVRIREGAMEILAGIGEPAVASLIVYLKNEDPSVRIRAMVILGEIGSHEAHEPITDLLRDSDPGVRREAFEALERVR